VLGSFRPREYDALMVANISNGDRLNHVLEQMGVLYFPCPQPSSAASQVTNKKPKAKVAKKPATKKAKVGSSRAPSSKMVPPPPKAELAKKAGVLKIARLKARPGLRGMSEIELALMKHVGVSNNFHILDVASSSCGPHATGAIATLTARVLAFDNLADDSSPDVRKTPSPGNMMEKHASSPPLVSGEFFYHCFL
jgi:hypothetical protein